MRREIIFRGRRKGSNEWLFGNLVITNDGVYIFPLNSPNSTYYYEVDPETVGQYTGLDDKNIIKIFEGDIFTHPVHRKDICVAEFKHGSFVASGDYVNQYLCYLNEHIEIIGNIHDSHKLLNQ